MHLLNNATWMQDFMPYLEDAFEPFPAPGETADHWTADHWSDAFFDGTGGPTVWCAVDVEFPEAPALEFPEAPEIEFPEAAPAGADGAAAQNPAPSLRLPGLALLPGPEREARRRRLEFHSDTNIPCITELFPDGDFDNN